MLSNPLNCFYDLVDIVVAMATNFEKPFYSLRVLQVEQI